MYNVKKPLHVDLYVVVGRLAYHYILWLSSGCNGPINALVWLQTKENKEMRLSILSLLILFAVWLLTIL
jgi:hypothetical protein